MSNFIQVKDSNLARDQKTGAILCVDSQTLENARKQKMALRAKKEKLKELEDRILQLEKTVKALINKDI
jgi:hypothetical protein